MQMGMSSAQRCVPICGGKEQKNTSGRDRIETRQVGLERTANPSDTAGNLHIQTSGAAKASVALSPPVVADADLRAVVDAWPALSPAMRAAVLAMVRAAGC